MASRILPKAPSLEFDKKRAKRLLVAVRRGDAGAVALFRAHHPRFEHGLGSASLALHDAQLVVAREYGFVSWPRYEHWVEARRATRAEQAAMLVRAATSNDLRRASALLDADPTLSCFDLFTACVCGEIDSVEQLLARAPERARSAGGPLGWQPIVYACFSRFLRRDPARGRGIASVVRRLLAGGADPSAFYLLEEQNGESHRQTCLYAVAGIANHAELTRRLLEAGADIHEGVPDPGEGYDFGGAEALYHASEFNDTSCLALLLGARPHARLVSYCLGRALDFDNEAGALLYLAHGADPNLVIPWASNRTHLHKAVMNRRSLRTVQALLEHGGDPNQPDADGLSPYRHAVRRGDVARARLLESQGARVETATAEDRALGRIAAGEASSSGPRPALDRGLLAWAARRNELELVTRWLDAGADIDAGIDMPPLHAACYAGRRAAVELLIARGADPHRKSSYGGDALASALYGSVNCCDPEGGPGSLLPEEITHGDYAGIVELLLAAGAQPPDHAWGSEAVCEVLRRHGVRDAH